jgi:hypothetical protein
MAHLLCLAVLLAAGCGVKSHRVSVGGDGSEPATSGARGGSLAVIPGCPELNSENDPPDTLECTGLFSDIKKKKVAPGAMPFAPASPLWSDGAEKHRWIFLPPGKRIDTSSPNDWRFPVGTRTWKEFTVGNKRIETRIFYKTASDRWRRATYIWNDDETQAEFTYGEDLPLDDGPYHVPEQGECDDCHDGQKDRLLGFDAISLGLPDAQGLTLKKLWENGWLTHEPELLELTIGDDGTELAPQALAILHINCGVSCHNDSPRRTANLTSQNLRLDVTQLDGRVPDETWNVLRTAIGQPSEGTQWGDGIRIVPGKPEESLSIQLMGSRRSGGGNSQMPPIASRVVDEEGLAIVSEWIARLPPSDE